MALANSSDRLPCGAQIDDLVAQIAGDAPPIDAAHQARCPFCQTALHALQQSWGDLQSLTEEPVPIPPGMTARIMTRVRDVARQAVHHVVLAVPRGRTLITHAVVAQIARRAALHVPGVLFASAQATPVTPAHPRCVKLELRLVTSYAGPPLTEIAANVRMALQRRVARLAGAQADEIDIVFADLAEPDH
jgi:hypothetical protein